MQPNEKKIYAINDLHIFHVNLTQMSQHGTITFLSNI